MADDTLTSFSADFPEADEASWRALVEKALKGKPPESLARTTRDGITVQPLYRESDWPSATNPEGQPGEAPFIRGATTLKDSYLPWDIRQVVAHPDLKAANADILKDLENGVSSIELRLDTTGEHGIALQTAADFDTLLDGVITDLAQIALSNSALEGFGLEAAALLVSWAEKKALDPSKQLFSFNVDPIGELARSGALSTTLADALKETANFVSKLSPVYTASTFIRVDGRPVYECGGSEAQELAFTIASGVTYLRALLDAGLSLEDANKALLFSVSVGPNYALEIAKLRALRRLWARVTESFGAVLPMKLQAVTAHRMLTKRDPWVNMLRNTAACFAGGVGGADVVTVRPFTDAIGLAGSLARRIGRNTQIMAQEESSLGKVTDPAGGTWSIGKMSEDIAQAAWALFQQIEGEGGVGPGLETGSIQKTLSATREALRKDLAKRKQAITGVSEFALIDEETPSVVDVSGLTLASPVETGPAPASRSFADLAAAASNGASLSRLLAADQDPHAQCDPLFPMRLSEAYEALRDHADVQAEKTGKRPEIFLACLGSIPDYNARASYAQNFFAAGGIAANFANAPYDTLEALVADFKESGALLVCLCSSDACYAKHAESAAKALKAARSDARIYLAGKPGAAEVTYRGAGIDDFIFVGVDVIAKLEIAHAELGLN